jgi:hypothetical protein
MIFAQGHHCEQSVENRSSQTAQNVQATAWVSVLNKRYFRIVICLNQLRKTATQESGEFGNELDVAIQKRQHLFLHIDILTSHTQHYSVDA